jgi:hypothetical protein
MTNPIKRRNTVLFVNHKVGRQSGGQKRFVEDSFEVIGAPKPAVGFGSERFAVREHTPNCLVGLNLKEGGFISKK